MDPLGWALLGLIAVVIGGIVIVVPIAAVAMWDLVREITRRAARHRG